jgi:hypothetical protein
MEKLLKVLLWILAVMTTIVPTMWFIGFEYDIPDQSLFVEIFKPAMIFWVFEMFVTGIVYVYIELKS